MKLIGFNVNKISAEKFSGNFKDLKIENNIKIDEITSAKADFFKKEEEILQIIFSYTLEYKPNLARLDFSGTLLLLMEEKEAKKALKQWENKKISDEIKIPLFNFILRKTNIRALELEEELNLPLHIKMPSLKTQKKE